MPKAKKKGDDAGINERLREIGFLSLSDPDLSFAVRKCLPTDLAAFDVICARDQNGVFGLPFGRQVEVGGKPDSGKTTVLLMIAAAAQRMGYTVLWIETEHSLSIDRAAAVGADVDKFMLATPDYLERGLAQMREAVVLMPEHDSPDYDENQGLVILFDSLAATPTKAELNGTEDSSHVAEFARKMAAFQRRMLKRISTRNVLVVYSNQPKAKIGVTFGRKSDMYGGVAVKHHCALRFEVKYVGKIKGADNEVTGIRMNIENMKNKCALPFRKVEELDLLFESGFDRTQALLMALSARGVAVKKGPWYNIPLLKDKQLRQSDVAKMIAADPGVYDKLRKAIDES